MKAVARKYISREAEGKQSSFFVRGKEQDINKVKRYWSRKGVSIDEVVDRTVTPEIVLVRTPSPQKFVAAKAFAAQEHLFFAIRDFHQRPFDTRALSPLMEKGCILLDFLRNCLVAVHQFRIKDYEQGGKTLRLTFVKMEKVLVAKHPLTLCLLCVLSLILIRSGLHDIATTMFQHIHNLSERIQGLDIYLSRVCKSLASMFNILYEEITRRCLEVIGATLESAVELTSFRARALSKTFKKSVAVNDLDSTWHSMMLDKSHLPNRQPHSTSTLDIADLIKSKKMDNLAWFFLNVLKQDNNSGENLQDHMSSFIVVRTIQTSGHKHELSHSNKVQATTYIRSWDIVLEMPSYMCCWDYEARE